MPTNGSWFKMYRKIRTSDLLQHPKALAVFIFLLTRVRLSDAVIGTTKVKAGQAFSSWKDVAEHTDLTRQEVRTAVKYLISTNRLTTKSTNRFTVFTIVKWDEFQNPENMQPPNQPPHQPTGNHLATNKQPPSNHIDRTIEYIEEKKQEQVGADPDRFPEAMVRLYTETPPTTGTAINCIRLSHPSFERVPEFQLMNALESHPDRERWGEAIEALAQGFAGVETILRPIPALNKYLGHIDKPKQKVWGE